MDSPAVSEIDVARREIERLADGVAALRTVYALIQQRNSLPPAPSAASRPQRKQGASIMRGVLRLAEMAPRLVAEADKKSDATADKLQAAFAKHDAVNEQYSRLADQVNKNAEDALAALAPLTNGAPPISGEPQPS